MGKHKGGQQAGRRAGSPLLQEWQASGRAGGGRGRGPAGQRQRSAPAWRWCPGRQAWRPGRGSARPPTACRAGLACLPAAGPQAAAPAAPGLARVSTGPGRPPGLPQRCSHAGRSQRLPGAQRLPAQGGERGGGPAGQGTRVRRCCRGPTLKLVAGVPLAGGPAAPSGEKSPAAAAAARCACPLGGPTEPGVEQAPLWRRSDRMPRAWREPLSRSEVLSRCQAWGVAAGPAAGRGWPARC
jgi:hypothetical protein